MHRASTEAQPEQVGDSSANWMQPATVGQLNQEDSPMPAKMIGILMRKSNSQPDVINFMDALRKSVKAIPKKADKKTIPMKTTARRTTPAAERPPAGPAPR
ncbi:MAG: hypothetical protein JWN70_2272 [Planctomycetaceae bacterium]|nr:hypothetical protein [Planctomycetaceae bacterium]